MLIFLPYLHKMFTEHSEQYIESNFWDLKFSQIKSLFKTRVFESQLFCYEFLLLESQQSNGSAGESSSDVEAYKTPPVKRKTKMRDQVRENQQQQCSDQCGMPNLPKVSPINIQCSGDPELNVAC